MYFLSCLIFFTYLPIILHVKSPDPSPASKECRQKHWRIYNSTFKFKKTSFKILFMLWSYILTAYLFYFISLLNKVNFNLKQTINQSIMPTWMNLKIHFIHNFFTLDYWTIIGGGEESNEFKRFVYYLLLCIYKLHIYYLIETYII